METNADGKDDSSGTSFTLSRRLALVGIGSVVTGLAGCGGGGASDGDTTPAPPPAPPPAPEPVSYWSGVATQSTADIAKRTFSAKWTHTLVPEIGQMPSWLLGAGLGTPTVRDCFGYLRHARLGEARFWGARRVENKLRGSGDFSNGSFWWSAGSVGVALLAADNQFPDAAGTFRTHRLSKLSAQAGRAQDVGVLPAVEHTFSIYARAETLSQVYIQFYIAGGAVLASGLFDVKSNEWTRIQINGTPDGIGSCRVLVSPGPFSAAAPGSVLICNAQLEDVSGSNNAASEYVSTDLAGQGPVFNGAMVDGVAYFDRYKGNTVSVGIVSESRGASIPADVLRFLRIEPTSTNLCTQTELFTTWSAAGGAVVAATATKNLRCENRSVQLSEGTQSGEKYIGLDLGAVAAGTPFTFTCFAKAGTARMVRLTVKAIDGGTCNANYDLTAGAVGGIELASGRQAWAHIEAWADGWYRCVLTTSNASAGGGSLEVRIGVASDDGSANYQGAGRSIFVWGANASPVEYPTSYLPNISDQLGAARRSHSVEIPNTDARTLGQQNFVVTLESVLAYYSGITIKGGSTPQWKALWYAYASVPNHRQNRLGVGLRPTTVAFFGDRYLGDPNPLYYWKPNVDYKVGDIVIPTDTLPDNQNSRRMFVCMTSGRSGMVEPTWNPKFVPLPDQVTNITVDGSVRWQNNHDNTIQGIWEPYDTCILDYGVSAFPGQHRTATGASSSLNQAPSILVSSFSSPGAYGYSVNGQNAPLRTTPFPIDGTTSGDLHLPMEMIRFGRLNEAGTSHPLSVGNIVISTEQLAADVNRLRTIRSAG